MICSHDISAGDHVRINGATLAVAIALTGGSAGPSTSAVRGHISLLLDAGLVTRSGSAIDDATSVTVEPWFARLVGPIASGQASIEAERFTGAQVARATVFTAEGGAVVVEHHRDGTCSLSALGPEEEASALADFVGFDPSVPRATNRRLPMAPSVLDRFHGRLIAGDGPAAAAVLSSNSGLSRDELALLLDLVRGRCHSWRVITSRSTIVVVDGVERGIWRSRQSASHGGDPGFVSASPADVFGALAAMLNQSDDSRSAA